ncbi:MAG: class I SAM-dependent methyltransferase [Prolixibacteraceae bacterium]|jgi:2-polyprenyl-3-methyl-5-hydroxy-6-metoxy-1,4-benzoquinol methylase|nr:class I SAM-dependent methyltransferase [Prolixibacteraceae bacterium]
MHYDPIKHQLGNLFNSSPLLRKLFYLLLDLLLLRAWHVNKALKTLQQNNTVSVKSVLDAGSGFGQYCYGISRLFPSSEILGVDVKLEQIDACNRFFQQIGKGDQVSFAVADLTQYKAPGKYNLILSVDVMEHILEDELVFRNFSESLQPGGMLLISTPSDQGGSDTDHHGEEGVRGFIEEHVRDGYNMEDIRKKLLTAGFSRVETSYTYGKYGSVAWKLSMKVPILMLGFSKIFYLLLPFYYLVVFPFCAILNYIDVNQTNKSGTGLLVKAYK